MHFGTKNYLKSNHNHTVKQTLDSIIVSSSNMFYFIVLLDKIIDNKHKLHHKKVQTKAICVLIYIVDLIPEK
jgi:hypothetical protein